MKINIKIVLIALACVFVIGGTAFFSLNSKPPTEPGLQGANNSDPAATVNVDDIGSTDKGNEIDPPTISPSSKTDAAPDVIDPSKSDTDITVPLTDPTEKPPEANPDKHEKGSENKPPKPSTTPPPASKPATPKSSEPQSGDTNSKGQVWVPGFGWVTPGSGNQGGETGSDGDINKPVGDM